MAQPPTPLRTWHFHFSIVDRRQSPPLSLGPLPPSLPDVGGDVVTRVILLLERGHGEARPPAH
eukprot:6355368-Pyramimonas_sp.AAC.1